MNDAELTGQARTHIAAVADPPCLLHAQVVTPFLNLRRAARDEGIDLVAMSSFRDFGRQLSIWNGKFSGERPMLDASGAQLDAATLTPRQRIDAILLWSALPGFFRDGRKTEMPGLRLHAGALPLKGTKESEAGRIRVEPKV